MTRIPNLLILGTLIAVLVLAQRAATADTEQAPNAPSAPPWERPAETQQAERGKKKEKKSKLQFNLGSSSNSFNLSSEEQYLAWESWHRTVTKEMKKAINHAVGRRLGLVTVHVTIDKDRKVLADIVNSSSPIVAQACLEGVRTLDGDPSLQFPTETQRETVSFDLEFKKALFQLPRDTYIKDDVERVTKE